MLGNLNWTSKIFHDPPSFYNIAQRRLPRKHKPLDQHLLVFLPLCGLVPVTQNNHGAGQDLASFQLKLSSIDIMHLFFL